MRLDNKAAKTPRDMEFDQDTSTFGFSMPKNHIYNSSLFGSIAEFESFKIFSILSCLSLFNELTTLAVELPATMVVALHRGENLV